MPGGGFALDGTIHYWIGRGAKHEEEGEGLPTTQ